MDAKSKIEAIESVKEMIKLMENLGVSDEGLKNIEEMKERVINEIQKSQKEAKWSPGQASIIVIIVD